MYAPYLLGSILCLSVAAALASDADTYEQRRQMEQALDLKIRQSLYRQRVRENPPPRLEERLSRQRLEQLQPLPTPGPGKPASTLNRALERQRLQLEQDTNQLRWEMERRNWHQNQ